MCFSRLSLQPIITIQNETIFSIHDVMSHIKISLNVDNTHLPCVTEYFSRS